MVPSSMAWWASTISSKRYTWPIGDLDAAGFDIVDEALQDTRREVGCIPAVGGQPDARVRM